MFTKRQHFGNRIARENSAKVGDNLAMQTLVSRLSSHTPTTQQELDFEVRRCVEGLQNGSVDMAEFMRQRKVLTEFFESVKTKLGNRIATVFSK